MDTTASHKVYNTCMSKDLRVSQADIRIKNKKVKIIAYLTQGLHFKEACLNAGVDPSTGHRWKQKDATFATQVEAGIIEYKWRLIQCVNAAAIKNGKIALKMLQLRFPNEWDPKRRYLVYNPQEELHRIHSMIYGQTCPREVHT